MSKLHFVLILASALALPACATDETESSDLVEVTNPKADQYSSIPSPGVYTFNAADSGVAGSGDILRLELTASKTFKATVADEWQGNTSHTGTFKLYESWNRTAWYIDLIEGATFRRYEYYMDPVLSQIWLRQIRPTVTQRWFALINEGGDCMTAGCGAGETCTPCWGENVCLPANTSC